jgi:hypothetical protein
MSEKDMVYRGSRKHVLDWTGSTQFLAELEEIVSIDSVRIPDDAIYLPRGYVDTREARLESFGPLWIKDKNLHDVLQHWWLAHPHGANTPNWDIAVGCEIEGKRGFVLCEAKANIPELSEGGKTLSSDASAKSKENHAKIGDAIAHAADRWRAIDPSISISHESHYQFANRLAFTWKLASLGVPVVLMYLGFLGDEGIVDVGEMFHDHDDWQRVFVNYTSSQFPQRLLGKRIELESTPVRIISRSKPVAEVSPKRNG